MNPSLTICHLSKSYGSLNVLRNINAELKSDNIYCLTAPSGAGKTTLFRLIMGLERPDEGTISFTPSSPRFAAVFQEDRLINHLSPADNLALVLSGKKNEERIYRELLELLPEESLSRPVCTLSGGMKRRCAFLRAMMSPSDVVIMDEPFTGLDDETKNRVIRYLLGHRENRLFLIATHDLEDIKKLEAVSLTLTDSQHLQRSETT